MAVEILADATTEGPIGDAAGITFFLASGRLGGNNLAHFFALQRASLLALLTR